MFTRQELERLAETKRLLVAQGEVHRSVLRLEAARWGDRIAQVRAIQQSLSAYRGIIMAAVAGAGLLLGTRGRSIFRWIPLGISLWRNLRKLWAEK
jgi:hypothetical protein